MVKNKFLKWLNTLKKSGKSDEEINIILSGVAKFSRLAIYEAIMFTLNKKEIAGVENIESERDATKKIEEIFKKKTGMTIDQLVAKTQMFFIEGKL